MGQCFAYCNDGQGTVTDHKEQQGTMKDNRTLASYLHIILYNRNVNNDNAIQWNDDKMKNNAKPSTNARFTVADLAREHEINPKIARRRLRDALKNNTAPIPANAPKNFVRDARLRHEFTESQRDAVLAIISRD